MAEYAMLCCPRDLLLGPPKPVARATHVPLSDPWVTWRRKQVRRLWRGIRLLQMRRITG